MRLQPRRTPRPIYFWTVSLTHPTPLLKLSRLISAFSFSNVVGMPGHLTLSPTCSLDIRIFTPVTSPITRESNTAESCQAKAPLTLREQYQSRGRTSDDPLIRVDEYVKPSTSRQLCASVRRPKLALNISLALSTFRGPEQGETTTPPPSPPSPTSTNESELLRREALKLTLNSLIGVSPRRKLALNIPSYPSRASRSPDASETPTPPLSPQHHPNTDRRDCLNPHDEGDLKLTRRSLTERPGKKPTLLNLLPYVQALIIHHLAKDEWLGKYSLRVTCRRFYSLIGPPRPDFDRYSLYKKGSLLSCKDCLRLRKRTEFVDYMRLGDFRPGGRSARWRYCIDCGLTEQLFEGRRVPPRLRKRTRLSVDGVVFVVCWYCEEFGRAPRREETHFSDCCRECFVDGSRWMWQLRDGEYKTKTSQGGGLEKVLDG